MLFGFRNHAGWPELGSFRLSEDDVLQPAVPVNGAVAAGLKYYTLTWVVGGKVGNTLSLPGAVKSSVAN
ncbi:hypothetical protein BaRGS_00006646 [Batillaria attramentaria]|uniref:Uncharacterized protein n=1 Tax=Batillaria attramentaria TaxID=370345 RepID=A0ABD0LSE3_9CAEN